MIVAGVHRLVASRSSPPSEPFPVAWRQMLLDHETLCADWGPASWMRWQEQAEQLDNGQTGVVGGGARAVGEWCNASPAVE